MTIVVCSQIRAGGTVTYQAVAHFVEKLHLGRRLGYSELYCPSEIRTDWEVIKVPELSLSAQSMILQKDALGIYTYRNLQESIDSAKEAFNLDRDAVEEWYSRMVRHNGVMNYLIMHRANLTYLSL